MPKKAKGSTGPGRRGTHSHKSKKTHKVSVRQQFLTRHIDQVWEDVRQTASVHDGKTGPLGTTSRAELDEDVTGYGKNYCVTCSRYFATPTALQTHSATKAHKRRIKELRGARPHNQSDAEMAAGMGKPDNGVRLQPMQMEQ